MDAKIQIQKQRGIVLFLIKNTNDANKIVYSVEKMEIYEYTPVLPHSPPPPIIYIFQLLQPTNRNKRNFSYKKRI